MSIEVQQIDKYYGSQLALDQVSFKIDAGEVVGFLGPNGAGKSTMMRILTSYIPPSSGMARVCDFDVLSDPDEVRKRVGYLPENNPLYLDMYVQEYLRFVSGIYHLKNSKERIKEIIHTVGLEKEQRKKLGALSKGYRQRVGLAQALIHDPEVLILDEPTTGLDPLQLAEIRQLIKKVGETKTVMLSTHIMQEVEAVCDRVIIINEGKIIADDSVSHIVKNANIFTVIAVRFNGQVNRTLLETIPGVEGIKEFDNNLWRITAQLGFDIQPKLFEVAVKEGKAVIEMQVEEENLESVFVSLTSRRS